MNKKEITEYNKANRQVKKWRNESMYYNVIHDTEYTFADEYYKALQDDYQTEYIKPRKEEEDSR